MRTITEIQYAVCSENNKAWYPKRVYALGTLTKTEALKEAKSHEYNPVVKLFVKVSAITIFKQMNKNHDKDRTI